MSTSFTVVDYDYDLLQKGDEFDDDLKYLLNDQVIKKVKSKKKRLKKPEQPAVIVEVNSKTVLRLKSKVTIEQIVGDLNDLGLSDDEIVPSRKSRVNKSKGSNESNALSDQLDTGVKRVKKNKNHRKKKPTSPGPTSHGVSDKENQCREATNSKNTDNDKDNDKVSTPRKNRRKRKELARQKEGKGHKDLDPSSSSDTKSSLTSDPK